MQEVHSIGARWCYYLLFEWPPTVQGFVTLRVAELSERLEKSDRTARRYLETLRAAGWIATSPTSGGLIIELLGFTSGKHPIVTAPAETASGHARSRAVTRGHARSKMTAVAPPQTPPKEILNSSSSRKGERFGEGERIAAAARRKPPGNWGESWQALKKFFPLLRRSVFDWLIAGDIAPAGIGDRKFAAALERFGSGILDSIESSGKKPNPVTVGLKVADRLVAAQKAPIARGPLEDCKLCDGTGWRQGENGVSRCACSQPRKPIGRESRIGGEQRIAR